MTLIRNISHYTLVDRGLLIQSKISYLGISCAIVFFLSFAQNIYSQNYKEFETGFSTIFIDPQTVDSYHFGKNPAYINFSLNDEFLSLKNITKDEEGEYKKFTTPRIDRSYDFFASGKKSIDSTQKFKGSFGFTKLERKKWDWFFTRDYDTDNPFIIGDSTTGDSRINGILLNAQYAINISDDFSAGINIDYSVDEGLKTVSPRPTSEHRDIGAKIGAGFNIDKNISIGVTCGFSDKNEQISYREDEGSLTQETIILKFKGYDFPNVLRKKVETRYAYTNVYDAGLNFSYDDLERTKVAAFVNSGFEKTSIKDDALDPKGEGFWKDDHLEAGIKLVTNLAEDLNIGFIYRYNLNDGWAKYPPTDVLYYERNSASHSLEAGVETKIDGDLSAGLEAGFSRSSRDENDHYSIVRSLNKSNVWFGKIGINYSWSNSIATLISYNFAKKSNSLGELTIGNNTVYFFNNRIYDLWHLQSGYVKHGFSISSEISTLSSGTLLAQINYSLMKPISHAVFGNVNRNEFRLTLEYRVKTIY